MIISLDLLLVMLLMVVLPFVVIIISLFVFAHKKGRMLDVFLVSKNSNDLNA
jgi:hypothetical protein